MLETTIREFLSYLMVNKDYSAKTIPTYKSHLEKFFEWGDIKDFQDITPQKCEDYQAYRIEQGVDRNSNFNFVIALRSFLKFANKRKGCTFQIDLYEVPRRRRKERAFVTADDINKMLEVLPRERDRLILLLLFTSGARREEIPQFTVESFIGNSFRVMAKGNKPHVYYFDDTLAERLRVYMAMERITSGHVFRSTTGKPVRGHTVARIVKLAAELAGLEKKVTTHTVRHGFATEAFEAGADIRSIQVVMGHESIMTTEIYTHVSDKRKRETVQNYAPKIVDTHPVNIENLDRLYRPLA